MSDPQYDSPYEIVRFRELSALLKEVGGNTAVEIGCHTGVTTDFVAQHGFAVTGYDILSEVIEQGSRQYPDLDLRVGDSTTALAENGQVDLVVCLEVLEHLDKADQSAFMRDMAALVKPGGALLLSTPGRHSFWSYVERLYWLPKQKWGDYFWWDPSHKHVVSVRELREHLRAVGLRIDEFIGYFFLPRRFLRPFAIRRGPLARAGFDLIVVARKPLG